MDNYFCLKLLNNYTMPNLSPWLANTLEKVILNKIHEVTVAETVMLSDHLKQVTFQATNELDLVPGNGILIEVNVTEYRYYTIADFNREANTCQVIFYLKPQGLGSAWAKSVRKGDGLKFIIDQAEIQYEYHANQHFFFGDETSLGLYESFVKTAKNLEHEYFGILEMKEENHTALKNIKLLIDAVPSEVMFPAENAIEWMENMHPKCWDMWKGAKFYLTGREKSVQRFKKYLKNKGVGYPQIQSTPYLENGKTSY